MQRSTINAPLTLRNRAITHRRESSLYCEAKAIAMTLPTPAPVAAKIRRNSSVRRSLARAVYSLFIPIAMIHTGTLTASSRPCVDQTSRGTGRSIS